MQSDERPGFSNPAKKWKAEPGTVSAGTLRPEDLIPAFINYAETLDLANNDMAHEVAEIRKRYETTPGYFDVHGEHEGDLDQLFVILDHFAPSGHYFGAHEGDGADFGFWSLDDDPDAARTVTCKQCGGNGRRDGSTWPSAGSCVTCLGIGRVRQ